jgi:hypothetical protein
LLSAGCGSSRQYVGNKNDLCEIFEDNQSWYDSARKSEVKWGISISIMMAIIAQESSFDPKAKPPRKKGFLWIFPGSRPSSAYGYSQALDDTWDIYRNSTGNRWAKRSNFDDSVDFVGWYCHQSALKCGISKKDGYSLYLAYHEGHGGYNSKSFKSKGWLLQVARSVDARAKSYALQLADCMKEGKTRSSSCLWPF